MRDLLIGIFLVLWINVGAGKVRMEPFIKGSFVSMITDAAGFIYVSSEYGITRYNSLGKWSCSYGSKSNEKISSVDVKGGQRILVFHRETGRIRLLDNALSPIGEVHDLKKWGLIDPQLVCLSGESGIWVYDAGKNQILRMGFDGKELSASPLLSSFSDLKDPVRLRERGQVLMLVFENGKAMLLDQFGTPVSSWDPGAGRKLKDRWGDRYCSLNRTGDTLFERDINTLMEYVIPLGRDSVSEFSFAESRLLLLEPRGVSSLHMK